LEAIVVYRGRMHPTQSNIIEVIPISLPEPIFEVTLIRHLDVLGGKLPMYMAFEAFKNPVKRFPNLMDD
jgi:hypothetical protein